MVKTANKKMKAFVNNAGEVNVTAKQSPGKGEKRKSDVVAEPNDNVVKNKRKKKAKKNKNGILTAQEDVTTSNIQVKTENQNEGSEKKKKREKRKKKLVKQEYEPEAKKVLLENNLEGETESNDEKNESDHMGSEGQDGENESDAEVNGSDHMGSESQDGENESDAEVNGSEHMGSENQDGENESDAEVNGSDHMGSESQDGEKESDAEVNGSDAGEKSVKEEDRKKIGVFPEQIARTIVIENVPETMNEDKLISIFSTFGKVESVSLRAVYHSNEPNLHMWPKGVAEITKKFYLMRKILVACLRFEQLSSVFPSLQMNNYILEGHTLLIKQFLTARSRDQEKSVYVRNLPPSARDNELKKVFADCGRILGVHIVRDKKTGVSRGFGYVNFESKDSVELALTKDRCIFKDRVLTVLRSMNKEVIFSHGKGKRNPSYWIERTPKPSQSRRKKNKKANNTNKLSSQGETIGDSGKAKKAKVGSTMNSIINEVLGDGPQFQTKADQEPTTPK